MVQTLGFKWKIKSYIAVLVIDFARLFLKSKAKANAEWQKIRTYNKKYENWTK